MKKNLFILLFLITIIFSACVSVKPYQKAFLNDEDMDLGIRLIENYESEFESYREGASGANGGKVGGGCGCN
jgi:hypothetical protein|tara:strand:+ start:895 stop:1110 length:216 start_codon:yes stop_codon:yes gene_type:complete